MAFAITKPTDSRWQALVCNFLTCLLYPTLQRFVIWEEFKDCLVSRSDIFWIATQGCPSKWTFTLTEEWSNVSRNEAWEIKGSLISSQHRFATNRITVIKNRCASILKADHRFHMFCHRFTRAFRKFFRIALCEIAPLFNSYAFRQI